MTEDNKNQVTRKKKHFYFSQANAIALLTGYSRGYCRKVLRGDASNSLIEYYAKMYRLNRDEFMRRYLEKEKELNLL